MSDSIENAKAVYARLEPPTDIDVYTFTVTKPVHVHARAFVPLVADLEKFLPNLAVAGPWLPATEEKITFTVPKGYRAVVVKNTPRERSDRSFMNHSAIQNITTPQPSIEKLRRQEHGISIIGILMGWEVTM